MVQKKSNGKNYKKGSHPLRPWIKATTPAVGMIAKAVAIKTVNHLLNVETKWYDLTQPPTAISSGFNMFHVPSLGLTQGDGPNTRDGVSLKVKSIMTNLYFDASLCTQHESTVRLICVYQPIVNNNFLTPADILTDPTNPQDLLSPYSMDTQGMKIVYDKTFKLGTTLVANNLTATANQSNSPHSKVIKHVFKPENMHIKWNSSDTVGATAAIERGFYGWFISTTNLDGTSTVQVYSRIKYVDN